MENIYLLVSASLYIAIISASYLFVRRQLEKGSSLFHIIILIFVLSFLTIVFDTLNRLDFGGFIYLSNTLYVITVLWNYIFIPAISGLWVLYIISAIYFERRIPLFYYWIVGGILLFNALLAFHSLIPNSNIYFRIVNDVAVTGELVWLYALVFVAFFITASVALFRYIALVRLSQRYIYFIIFTLPVLGFILQFFFAQVPFLLIGYVFSFMILAMSVQYIHATTDFLTGLNNRQSLTTHLHRRMSSISSGDAFAIIMVDLDNFKTINDTLGHTVGDDALRLLARFLRYHCRGGNFVARFGGDEFIIVSDKSTTLELDEFVNEMLSALEKFTNETFGPYRLTFSSGYYLYKKDSALSLTELFTIIDSRMFENKRERNNNVI